MEEMVVFVVKPKKTWKYEDEHAKKE